MASIYNMEELFKALLHFPKPLRCLVYPSPQLLISHMHELLHVRDALQHFMSQDSNDLFQIFISDRFHALFIGSQVKPILASVFRPSACLTPVMVHCKAASSTNDFSRQKVPLVLGCEGLIIFTLLPDLLKVFHATGFWDMRQNAALQLQDFLSYDRQAFRYKFRF